MCYGYIYLIEDINTGKKYVGQHKNKNFMLDDTYHGSGTFIKKIRKSRPETLVESIICGVNSLEEANFFENYWIEKLNTIYPNGYNLNTGGGVNSPCFETIKKLSESHKGKVSGMKGKKHSEETKEKLRKITISFWQNEDYINKHCGENNPMFGKKLSEETKKKRSKYMKKLWQNEEFRKLFCGENNQNFGKKFSEEEIEKIRQRTSSLWQNEYYRKRQVESHTGYKWTEEQRRKNHEKHINGKCSKQILQFTLDGEFVAEYPSINEAQRQTGISNKMICGVLKGKRKSTHGFKWYYK